MTQTADRLTFEEITQLLADVHERDEICVEFENTNDANRKCSVNHDPHHVITQQILRRHLRGEELHRALRDIRNVVFICRLHHKRVHAGTRRIDDSLLRDIGFYEFLEEFGLKAVWDGIVAKQLPTHRRLEI